MTSSKGQMRAQVSLIFTLLTAAVSALIMAFTSKNPPEIWLNCGTFLQLKWEIFLDYYSLDETSLWIYGSNIVVISTFWISGLTYVFVDVTGIPEVLKRYKSQPNTNQPVETKKLIKAILVVLSNQLLIGIPLSYLGFTIHSHFGGRELRSIRELPSISSAILEFFIYFPILYEIAFYYSHRLLHHRVLYKYIHKMHHEWTAPISITALYCHPVEHILSNMLPPMISVILVNSHVISAWFFFAYVILGTLYEHSGYHLPFLRSNEFHDFHHLKFTSNFGATGLLDRLHGTDALFLKSPQSARHYRLTSLTPAIEVISDEHFFASKKINSN